MNEEKLKEYYDQYSHLIFKRAIQIVRDEEDAKDVVQTVFYRIWKYGDKFNQRSEIFTWIYRITTNCAFDLLKKKTMRNKEMQFDEAFIPDQNSGIDILEQKDFLMKKIASCEALTRQIVFLYYNESLTQQEIAEFMNISRKTVGKRLKKFKNKIKGYIDE